MIIWVMIGIAVCILTLTAIRQANRTVETIVSEETQAGEYWEHRDLAAIEESLGIK